ncbi:MAG: UDP-N-acetylglucosamine 1-carboxyvinyltransferase 1 [Candidatus Anoxychlamydiales bacterium]|nr:UDP-N-acetylglucosamine 1-carboxyvinyltransferase 1 [Candidatus Anoxychlamydiales bacterium]
MNNISLKIKGFNKLNGSITAGGAKNATTKLLVASLLSDKKCIFQNVPNIKDVEITVELLKEIGSEISWDKEKKIIEVQTKEIKNTLIPQRFSGANRIPILMLGALLNRTKNEIIVPTLGGDELGSRPLDFHISSLRNLGAIVEYKIINNEKVYSAIAKDNLKGSVINLDYPSVGATENSILAGIRAKGKTVIKNAAIEPEIIDLILFLQKIGANIRVAADRTIHIKETNSFNEATHFIIYDRNEIISYALLAIASKGKVFIKGAEQIHLISFLNKLREVNGNFRILNDGIEFFYDKPLIGGVHIETKVHPGFMTDWQQPFVVLLTQAEGSSVIHETVYDNRFGYTKTLKSMGAKIELFTQCLGSHKCRFNMLNHNHSLIVKGPTSLIAKNISIPDLRAGFAYVMAAILASGETIINGAELLDRGYENIDYKLSSIGASIKRIQNPNILENILEKETIQ